MIACKAFLSERRRALVDAGPATRARGLNPEHDPRPGGRGRNQLPHPPRGATDAEDPSTGVAEIYARADGMEAVEGFVQAVEAELGQAFARDTDTSFGGG